MKNILIYGLLLIGITTNLKAQNTSDLNDTTTTLRRKLVLKAKNTGEKILLRWAPDSPGVWHLSNTKGYMIERMAFKEGDSLIDTGYQLITPDSLRPWPLDKWEPIANEASGDKYAAIAAQAIHGKRNFSDTDNKSANFVQKANELNSLFSFALLASEFSPNAALAAGLRFEDADIDASLNYVYRVYSNASNQNYQIDTAYVMIKGGEITPKVIPDINKVEEGEKFITLKWDRSQTENFSAWYIEKSSDNGKTFKRLNTDPYVHSIHKDQVSEYIVYRDSVKELYKKQHYRIIGINTFAELSEPSKSVIAIGRDKTPPPTPQGVVAEQINENSLKITWNAETVPDSKGFYITKSGSIGGKEELITKDLLAKDARSYTDSSYNQLKNNWYQIYAIDTVGNAIVSHPTFGAVRDDIAPMKPTDIQGKIDTTGIVKLQWKTGDEKDLFGYHVYFANAENHVFSKLTPQPIRDTVFIDSIKLDVLTESIFYKIKAVDIRGNVSTFSETLLLKKPDMVSPVAPVFNDYLVLESGIQLSWAASSSNDIEAHYLYRKDTEAVEWELIYSTNTTKDQDSYLDDTTTAGSTYAYKIVAEDDAGLQTNGVYIITLTAIDFMQPLPVKNINAVVNNDQKQVRINWTYPKKNDFTYILYRAINGAGFTILKTIAKEQVQFIDKKIEANNSYEYAMQVHYANNKKSAFSPIRKVVIN